MILERARRKHRGLTQPAIWLALAAGAAAAAAAPAGAGGPPSPPLASVQTRCGWYSNPGPANHYLFDRDGRWVIGEQGSRPARGFDSGAARTNATSRYWVRENVGSYGYGCLCLQVEAEPGAMRISRVHSSRQRPLAVCRADRRLPVFESGRR